MQKRGSLDRTVEAHSCTMSSIKKVGVGQHQPLEPLAAKGISRVHPAFNSEAVKLLLLPDFVI